MTARTGPPSAPNASPPVLQARRITVGYGPVAVVREVDLQVGAGELVALIGPNGAGKTTTLMALGRHLRLHGGTIAYRGQDVSRLAAHRLARGGVALVPERRTVISQLSVRDNLRVARCDLGRALALFPELGPLLRRRGGLLSGGEQQMLCLARALARGPSLVLADELSLGLAPLVIERLLTALRAAADGGAAVLLVEQHVTRALGVADRGYVLSQGRIRLRGSGAELLGRLADIEHAYLAGPSDNGPDNAPPTGPDHHAEEQHDHQ